MKNRTFAESKPFQEGGAFTSKRRMERFWGKKKHQNKTHGDKGKKHMTGTHNITGTHQEGR
jgi:hypothetical protein